MSWNWTALAPTLTTAELIRVLNGRMPRLAQTVAQAVTTTQPPPPPVLYLWSTAALRFSSTALPWFSVG